MKVSNFGNKDNLVNEGTGQDHCHLNQITRIVTKAPEPINSIYFLQRVAFEIHMNNV